jgi:DNA-binding MarR family transcriptional regulator
MSRTELAVDERLLGLFNRVLKQALGDNPLEDSGITPPQLALLDYVAASPGCGVGEIADGLALTAPTVSVGMSRLEKAGVVERQPDPQDGRAVQFFLTGRGQVLHERALTCRLQKVQQLLAGLTLEEEAQLISLLEKAVDAL